MSPTRTDQRLGQRFAGKYLLEGVLGRGGMGVVYRGKHEWTGRAVAVKILNSELADDPAMTQRFLHEARAAAAIEHPNVVDVLDMGKSNEGDVYIALEYLEGHSLGEHLDRYGKLSVDETLSIILPVLDALAEAHRKGIIHRDLKPDNLFLSMNHEKEIVPKLLDFGIAKLAGRRGSTESGTVLGTPNYMSPEQTRGLADLSPASDVWAIGTVIYECLSGEMLFDGPEPMAVLGAIAMGNEPKVAIAGIPPALNEVLQRCLKKDRNMRIKDAGELALALRSALVGETHRIHKDSIRPLARSSSSFDLELDLDGPPSRNSRGSKLEINEPGRLTASASAGTVAAAPMSGPPRQRPAPRPPPAHRPPPNPAILRGVAQPEPSSLGRLFGPWFDESPSWLRTMVTTLVGATLLAFAYGVVMLALRLI